METITVYREGHVKRDPDTGAVAIRTSFPDDELLAGRAWIVASPFSGVRHAGTDAVTLWVDLFVPPVPEEPEPEPEILFDPNVSQPPAGEESGSET